MAGGDKAREECGVFGIYGPGLDVARLTFYGLFALQHRGQESAGMAVADGRTVHLHKGMGLAAEVFGGGVLDLLRGHIAVGHVRYSTAGASHLMNAQPLVFRYAQGIIGLAHNGNLTNAGLLRRRLAASGSIFQTTSDTEVIGNLMARHGGGDVEESVVEAVREVRGAYSLVILTEEKLIAVRDPFGFRPLCLGRLGDAYVVASESCALDAVEAEFVRDVAPGEMLVVDEHGLTSHTVLPSTRRAHCIFEYIYLARPDSYIDGFHVHRMRRKMGQQLACEYRVPADLVIPVPDSGISAARGYAEAAGLPYEEGLMKNRYVGRTFIQPEQSIRDLGVRLKLNPVRDLLAGRRVILVDDSLVRGTTSGKIVAMLRESGVRSVHLCLGSPPVRYPCYYGIDTANREELVAAHKSVEEIRRMIGADGLYYLSLEGLRAVFGGRDDLFCTACFSGDYPSEVPAEDWQKLSLETGGGKRWEPVPVGV
ncbi:MAG: amidophosphoribosyltransferase [Firmicutes bacterium]|nr:amidophosphoribosyltransferase [Bacillota bacterium]